jgi:integrase
MARGRFKLTWQAGSGRRGRWKKMYRGRILYFDGGRGKSDAEAYQRAVAEFDRQKVLIEAELSASRPHRQDYDEAIAEWECVLMAARDAEDNPAMIVAAAKIDELRKRMLRRKPPAVSKRFDYPVRRFGLRIGKVSTALGHSDVSKAAQVVADSVVGELDLTEQDEDHLAEIVRIYAGDAIWKDRLAKAQKKSDEAAAEVSVRARVASYVLKKRNSGITASASENIRRRLEYMQRKIGPDVDASLITGKHVDDLHQALLKDCADKRFSRAYAADIFKTAKMFIRWLDEIDVLAQLPKNLKSSSLRITPETPTVLTYSIDQIHQLFTGASDTLQLYMLLALNCGMTQVDISDLRPQDINWQNRTLSRRRGKTADSERVPTVTYKLWDTTFRLLQQLRTEDPNHLLTTVDGKPLRFEGWIEGRFTRRDSVRYQFDRHMKAVGAAGNFKGLKKTSASLLRDHSEFNGIESVFLDHAPRSVSDKHYTKVPTGLLAKALDWLALQYGL